MGRSDIPTAKISPAPIVLTVGCSKQLVTRCRDAAVAAQALVVETDVASSATMAAQTRPLVLLMPDEVFAFDATGFSSLAADVRARLVLVPDSVESQDLESMLSNAMSDAESSRASRIF